MRTPELGERSRLRYIPALDGLRGVAVAGVLAFHVGHLTGGYLGVDLFFVISGYLITTLLVLEWAESGNISLSAFWARRARRLLPALLAVLLAVGIASHWLVLPVSRGQLRSEGIATMGYVANWSSILRGNGYWEQTLQPSWLQHTWSLAIEEQFYLVWPLVAVAVLGLLRRNRKGGPPAGPELRRRVRHLGLVGWTAGLGSAALMIGLASSGASHERIYLGTDTRAAAILFGVGLACRQFLAGAGTTAPKNRWMFAAAGMLGTAMLAVAWVGLSGDDRVLYRGGFLLCGVAATLVLLDVTTTGTSPLKRVLEVRPLRWLGIISYGLYLWHWPIFQYLHPGRFGLYGWSLVAARVGVSIAVATASFVLLERPVRRGALRGHTARLMLSMSAGAALVALVIGTAGALNPVPDFSAAQEAAAKDALAAPPARRTSSTGKPIPRVLILGDSVALSLGLDGIGRVASQVGITAVNRAVVGCTLVRDVGDPFNDVIGNCSSSWPKRLRLARPDIVILLFGQRVDQFPGRVDGRDVWPCEPAWQRLWRTRLDDAVTVLSARGAKVVLLSAPGPPDPAFKGDDPRRYDARQSCANQTLAEVAAKRREAGFVDFARFVCPTPDKCRQRLHGAEVRVDGLHFRGDGAKAMSRWLIPRVLESAGFPTHAPP